MYRMILWTIAGWLAGFTAMMLTVSNVQDPGLQLRIREAWLLFLVIGILPGTLLGALFGAVDTIRCELRETRRELLKHLTAPPPTPTQSTVDDDSAKSG